MPSTIPQIAIPPISESEASILLEVERLSGLPAETIIRSAVRAIVEHFHRHGFVEVPLRIGCVCGLCAEVCKVPANVLRHNFAGGERARSELRALPSG